MRWMVGLLTVILTGCQGFPFLETPSESDHQQLMPLWLQYQRCRTATDPVELMHIAQQLGAVIVTGATPPAWLNRWGPYVKPQPVRTSFDPRALGAACTLRAAAMMAQAGRAADARFLYERVLTRYAGSDWPYYHAQAREALARLAEFRSAMTVSLPLPHKNVER